MKPLYKLFLAAGALYAAFSSTCSYGQVVGSTIGGLATSPTMVDANSVFWNPAGIGGIQGTQFSTNIALVGGWLIYDRSGVNPNTGRGFDSSSTTVLSPNPFLSIASDLGIDDWSFGYATYFPTGAFAQYDEAGSQRYDLIRGSFVPWHHQFTLAYSPNDEWSFAVAGVYSIGFFESELDVDLSRFASTLLGSETVPRENPALASRVKIDRTMAQSVGGSFGILYRPSVQWSFGVGFFLPISYKFKTNLTLRMPELVQSLGAGPRSLGVEGRIRNDATVEMSLPALLNFGFRYQPFGYWTGHYFSRYTFGSLADFTKVNITRSPIARAEEETISKQGSKDSLLFGTTQDFSLWRPLRIGLMTSYAFNGVSDEALSTSRVDFDSLLVGLYSSYRWSNGFELGLEYNHSFMFEREVNSTQKDESSLFESPPTSGRYRAGLDRLGVSLSYEF